MFAPPTIDEIYEQFTRTLRPSEQPHARALPHTLGMAPTRDTRWGQVFSQDVVRALPIFLTEVLPPGCDDLLYDALTAHALAIIAAFAVDHIQDGQIARPPREVLRVVNELRRARDAALERLGPARCDPLFDYAIGEWDLAEVARMEQRFLREGARADFEVYDRVALEKQYAAFPAAMRLALAAGFPAERLELVRASVAGIALAFQMIDDVQDWKEDLDRGGSWPLALVMEARDADADEVRRLFASGILSRLDERAADALGDAARAADALGATRLARWAEAERSAVLTYAARERETLGGTTLAVRERRKARGCTVSTDAAPPSAVASTA